jgi:hypothetical protein
MLWSKLLRRWETSVISVAEFHLLDIWNYIVTLPEYEHSYAARCENLNEYFIKQSEYIALISLLLFHCAR